MQPGTQHNYGYIAMARAASLCGANRIFDLAALDLLLAVDAVGRPGECLQPLLADSRAAVDAFPKAALVQALERQPHQRKLLMSTGALAEKHFFLIGRDCLVGHVLRVVCGSFAALRYCRKKRLLQPLLVLAKLVLKSPLCLITLHLFRSCFNLNERWLPELVVYWTHERAKNLYFVVGNANFFLAGV